LIGEHPPTVGPLTVDRHSLEWEHGTVYVLNHHHGGSGAGPQVDLMHWEKSLGG